MPPGLNVEFSSSKSLLEEVSSKFISCSAFSWSLTQAEQQVKLRTLVHGPVETVLFNNQVGKT